MAAAENSTFWQGRPVFLTGATGLLGSWVATALVARGAVVTALVRDGMPGSRLWSTGIGGEINVVHGSLTDEGLLQRSFAEYESATVFHLAAQTLVGVAKHDPVGTLEANVRGTWLLLEAARQTGVKQVVVASSDKAYGPSETLPYKENDPLQGRYPYDVSKSCADLITTMYATTFGLPATIVRCGNLFGGGDLNYSRLIPGVIRATLRGERFIIRSDGNYVRDFLYVEDAADAYLTLAEAMQADPALHSEAFNFGLGLRPTMLELVHLITRMMGREDLAPIVQNTASAEIREQYLDATKASSLLRWTPAYGLEEGLRRTIDWYRNDASEPTRLR